MLNAQVKADLQEMKVNAMKTRNVLVNRNKLCPDKKECYASNGLGSMSVVVIRQVRGQAGKTLAVYETWQV